MPDIRLDKRYLFDYYITVCAAETKIEKYLFQMNKLSAGIRYLCCCAGKNTLFYKY